MRGKAIVVWSIVISILIGVNFWMFYSPRDSHSLVCCDEFEYYTIAHNFAEGNGYSMSSAPPYEPTLMREPGYPILLASLLRFLPEGMPFTTAQAINIILSILTALLLWKISLSFLPSSRAVVPPILLLLSPRVAHYSWTILSDTLSMFLLAISLWMLFKALQRKCAWMFIASGALFGALALTKMAFIVAPVLIVAALAVFRHLSLRNASLLLASVAFVIAPWIIRNTLLVGRPVLTVRSGQLLFARTAQYPAVHSIHDFAQMILFDAIPGQKSLFSAVDAHEPVVSPYGVNYGSAIQTNAPAKFFFLRKQYSEVESDRLMVNESWERIRAYPLLYLAQLPFEFIKFNYAEIIPTLFGSLSSQHFLFISIGIIIATTSLLLLGFFFMGILRLWKDRRDPTALCLLLILFYANSIHGLLYVTPRYSFTIYPLVLLATILGIRQCSATTLRWWLRKIVRILPLLMIAAGVVNVTFQILPPFIQRFANAISALPQCYSCSWGQFAAIGYAISVLFIVGGIGLLIRQWRPELYGPFSIKDYHRSLWILIFFLGALIFMGSMNRYFNMDEIEHIHSTWYVANGAFPYRDFFQQHHPLFWYTLSPLLSLVTTAAQSLLFFRFVMFLFIIGTMIVIYRIGKAVFSDTVAQLAVFFSLNAVLFINPMIEIRPDVPQTLFGLLAILFFFLFLQRPTLPRIGATAFFLAISFLYLQKIILLMAILVLLLVYEIINKRAKLSALLVYLVVLVGVLAPFSILLWRSQAFEAYWSNAWVANFYLPIRVRASDTLRISIIQNTLFWMFAMVGLWGLKKNLAHRTQQIFGVLALALFVLTTLVFKVALPQYFSPVLPLLAIAAAYGFWQYSQMRWTPIQKITALIIIGFIPTLFLVANAVENNREHLQKIQYILDRTTTKDAVFDSSGYYNLFRKDIDYLWYAAPIISTALQNVAPWNYSPCDLIREREPSVIIATPDVRQCAINQGSYLPTDYPDILLKRRPVSSMPEGSSAITAEFRGLH